MGAVSLLGVFFSFAFALLLLLVFSLSLSSKHASLRRLAKLLHALLLPLPLHNHAISHIITATIATVILPIPTPSRGAAPHAA